MEKLADGLQKLQEDDLLHVVQLVHDHKSPETYTKNDVESKFKFLPSLTKPSTHRPSPKLTATDALAADGEFHVDLYTLPDQLVKLLWDFTASKVDL
jgi:transcription initiation factor IIF auxiliary subunit